MRYAILLYFTLVSSVPRADIFKCTDEGRTVYADRPCSALAERMEVSGLIQPSGVLLTNDKQRQLGEQLGRSRKLKSLTRALALQDRTLIELRDDYLTQKSRLKQALKTHRQSKQTLLWKSHPDRRTRYYREEQAVQDRLTALKKRYDSNREKARQEQTRLREHLGKLKQ